MSFSIAGKTAIVTGAANGVGLAIARKFVEQGANVMLADKDEDSLKSEVDITKDDEGSARAFPCDIREKLSRANLLSATIDAFDRVDILVNASRQVCETDPFNEKDDTISEMLDQNLIANLRLSQLVAKRMIKQAEGEDDTVVGTILNLSSIAARRTRPELLGFSIATAALDQMTRGFAVSMAPHKIRVNAIAIGSVMSASLQSSLKENPDLREIIEGHTPLDRIAGAVEAADAAQFLCSDAAGFITGQVMTLDGGRTLLDPVDASVH